MTARLPTPEGSAARSDAARRGHGVKVAGHRCIRCRSTRREIEPGKKSCRACLAARAAKRAKAPPGPSPKYAMQFSREMQAARAEGAKAVPVWVLACLERGYAVGVVKGGWA